MADRRLLVVATSAEEAAGYVAEHHPDLLVPPSRWRWVSRVWDLSGASRVRDELVLLDDAEQLPDWPRIEASLVLLRLPVPAPVEAGGSDG